ncbi:MAG TPA: biotin/lipoyl-containing protein, partial [Anaeromyxobacteraceae bacterium]|nr:biotin/lipoyl-containing protein [Anaeromyxobacteraceae bacterium]
MSAIELKVPSLGESVQQATIGAWLKKEGDPVGVDEPVVEVESEKATVALPAPAAGVLRRVLKQTGDTVNVGEIIGELEAGAAAQPAAPAARKADAKPAAAPQAPAAAPAVASPPPPAAGVAASYGSARNGPTAGVVAGPTAATGQVRPLRAPPSARRLMAEHGL